VEAPAHYGSLFENRDLFARHHADQDQEVGAARDPVSTLTRDSFDARFNC
jgi:hypothetical protein